jgi:hypothetical protein
MVDYYIQMEVAFLLKQQSDPMENVSNLSAAVLLPGEVAAVQVTGHQVTEPSTQQMPHSTFSLAEQLPVALSLRSPM